MFFSAKAILEFFQVFYLNFNLEQYVSKKLHINFKNFVRFCRNLAFKINPRKLKNVDYFESYLKVKKALKS